MASARCTVVLVVIALSALTQTSFAKPTSRILGGEEIELNEIPYVVSVRLDNVHVCGGSIINQRSIITAAYCVVDGDGTQSISAERLSVRVGSTNQFAGGKIVYVANIITHPNYAGLVNNLAVLTLSDDLEFNEKVASIPIAGSPAEQAPVMADVVVAGWGEQSSGDSPYRLQSLNFIVASEEACLDAYSAADESVICLAHALKEGSCKGDAGNGGVYNGKLVALSNFVVGACGARYPDVFLNVAHYADWIKSVIM